MKYSFEVDTDHELITFEVFNKKLNESLSDLFLFLGTINICYFSIKRIDISLTDETGTTHVIKGLRKVK